MSTVTSTESTTTATVEHHMVFVNLPVADLARSREFFTAIGYTFDERMCDGNALGLQLGPNIYAMLLGREFFATFHNAETATPGKHEVLTCLSAGSREEVDAIVDRAVAAGGTQVNATEQGGFMYGRSYADLDGHIWEILWMDVTGATDAGVFG
ncbi:MAG: glyoxalase [Dermatophilus congolensis]|nr:glyoxalase [Dermatophilus congolensis]